MIRIATYNVENFFSARHPRHAKKSRACRALARMVARVDADILGVQEVESTQALAELNDRLPTPYEHYGVLEGNSSRGIHLGFMSRLPFDLTSHRETTLVDEDGAPLSTFADEAAARDDIPTPVRFQRDLLLARFVEREPPIAVFNAHLKSRIRQPGSGSDTDGIRLAEARALSGIVSGYEQAHPDHLVVLLGDFNQRHEHASLAPIQSLGYFDPILTELMANDARLSTHSAQQGDRIDYLLLGRAAAGRYAPGSATVHDETMARKASDHYPVSIVLDG